MKPFTNRPRPIRGLDRRRLFFPFGGKNLLHMSFSRQLKLGLPGRSCLDRSRGDLVSQRISLSTKYMYLTLGNGGLLSLHNHPVINNHAPIVCLKKKATRFDSWKYPRG